MSDSATLSVVPPPSTPDDLSPLSVLGVCASLKPAPGSAGRSATRSVLQAALGALARTYPHTFLLDLRDRPPPLFDGRMPEDRPEPEVRFSLECVRRAGALLLSVPAYWSDVSGVFKNFVDVLCGPAYDLPDPKDTPFSGKLVGAIVIGADEPSTIAGVEQTRAILESVGARFVAEPIAIANPRLGVAREKELWDEVITLAVSLARETVLRARSTS